jgi:hypothetical protein
MPIDDESNDAGFVVDSVSGPPKKSLEIALA